MKDYIRQLIRDAEPAQATNVMMEYVQARVLQSLQEQGAWRSLAFHGGTALRFLYRTPRFSEDLDFSLEHPGQGYDFAGLLEGVRGAFQREAYAVEMKASTRATVHKAFVKFPGLEYEMGLSPHSDKAFSIKVEVDTNPPAGAVLETTIVRRYETLRLVHHDRASLLAGKIGALLLRDWLKGRDVYDLVWYLSDPAWPEPNETLLRNACAQAGRADIARDSDAWRRALVERLEEASWAQVEDDVAGFLERPQERWMLERQTVRDVLARRGWMP